MSHFLGGEYLLGIETIASREVLLSVLLNGTLSNVKSIKNELDLHVVDHTGIFMPFFQLSVQRDTHR